MKISIRGGGKGKGWSNYVTRKYVQLSKEEREKITFLSGNTKLGDSIIKSSSYKDNSLTFVLAFNGRVSKSQAKAVLEDFEKLFMHGFSKDEYHLDGVLHQDTEHDHIHIRILTKNLLTDTQLRLYYHDKHKKFINAIRDYLIIKHELPQPTQEHKQVFSVESKKERLIQEQRAKEGREPFDFSKKKGRTEGKKYIANYIAELHESGLIEDFNDLKEVIKGLDLEIVKIGKDITGDFNYFTIQDNAGNKIRLQGEIYNAEFWEHQREDREKQIRANRIPSRANQGARTSLEVAERRLKRELEKREKEVRKRYEASRRKSREKQVSAHSIQVDNSNTNSPIRGIRRGSVSNEVSNENTVKLDTKQSNSDIRVYEREAINDRTRTDFKRRARERESILTRVRESTPRERTSLFEQFREDRESLYNQAKRTMRSKRQRRRARERLGKSVGGIRETISSFQNLLNKYINKFAKNTNRIIGRIEEFGRIIEKSKIKEPDPFEKVEKMQQTSKKIEQELNKPKQREISDDETPSYGLGMGM